MAHKGNTTSAALFIERPHVTEKTAALQERGVYTFIVDSRATKPQIEKAIHELYKVTPRKVRVVTIHAKHVSGRGRGGTRSGYKKAVVFLEKGEKIEL